MTIEEPKFTLALKDGAFELRDYSATVVAEVTVTGDQQEAGRKGFRLLAGYIFGANRRNEKIAITAPVSTVPTGEKIAMTEPVAQVASEDSWQVRFTMLARYALATLPIPNSLGVMLKDVPAGRFAVLRFSGLTGEARVVDETAKLMAHVRAQGLVPAGPVSLARYDPPWALWLLRRNEVMLAVATGD